MPLDGAYGVFRLWTNDYARPRGPRNGGNCVHRWTGTGGPPCPLAMTFHTALTTSIYIQTRLCQRDTQLVSTLTLAGFALTAHSALDLDGSPEHRFGAAGVGSPNTHTSVVVLVAAS